MSTNTALLARLKTDSDLGDPYLSCNAGRKDINEVIALVKDLEEKLRQQVQFTKDCLCVIGAQHLQLQDRNLVIPTV